MVMHGLGAEKEGGGVQKGEKEEKEGDTTKGKREREEAKKGSDQSQSVLYPYAYSRFKGESFRGGCITTNVKSRKRGWGKGEEGRSIEKLGGWGGVSTSFDSHRIHEKRQSLNFVWVGREMIQPRCKGGKKIARRRREKRTVIQTI